MTNAPTRKRPSARLSQPSGSFSDHGGVGIDRLTVTYRRQLRPALELAGITLTPGVTVLLGPNGAGKTTLLKTLAGLQPASHLTGQLTTNGQPQDVRHWHPSSATVGYMPQHAALPPQMTARDYLLFAAWLAGLNGTEAPLAADAWLAAIGLEEKAGERCLTLSGGMARRLLLASSMVATPTLMLMDEPTVGLDPQQRMQFRSLVRELPTSTATIISTHQIDDLDVMADAVMVINGGHVVFYGSLGEMLGSHRQAPQRDRVEAAYLGLIQGYPA